MNRIRWYGPTLILLITILIVMIAGPGLARRIEFARKTQYITNVRDSLEQTPSLVTLSESFRKVAKVVEPSVVHIEVASRRRARTSPGTGPEHELFRRFFGPRFPSRPETPEEPEAEGEGEDLQRFDVPSPLANGSGWVYDAQGHIVTNNHVVENADEITVRFHDKSERKATVIGRDPKTDIAVLKVEGDSLHPATIAPEPVQQGDIVFAFGSPFRFDFSMSQGIVSGKGRELHILRNIRGYENFIQTDAAINPGNSGGPLTNIFGQVVGMNTAIATRTGTYNGLGFAIPVDMIDRHVRQIIDQGKVVRGYLGIFIKDIDPKMARTFGFEGRGVLVDSPIESGPALAAGIRRGDIITHLDDKSIDGAEELRRTVARYAPGSTINVKVFRNGESLVMPVIVAEQPDDMSLAGARPAPAHGGAPDEPGSHELLRKLGIESVQALDDATAQRLGSKIKQGVQVLKVRVRSAAAAAFLRTDSVITHVMDEPVATTQDLVNELEKHDLTEGVRLSVEDRGVPRFVLLELRGE